MVRAFHFCDFDLSRLVAAKHDTTISFCLPARDEEDTVGAIVDLVQRELVERTRLVDEILVIDDRSVDGTAKSAAAAKAPSTRAHGSFVPTACRSRRCPRT